MSHANSKQKLELQLSDIVTYILVVHEVPIRVGGFVVSNAFGYVRLEER